MSLGTSLETVRTLQTALQTKAKAEPTARFYSLWDKVCREDVLAEAYRRCRANRGAPGVDAERFEDIDEHRQAWLEGLRQELRDKRYAPRPLLRVWIPKASGGERPLGIPTIRDRVVQMAVLQVIGPIFEVDLLPWQYGFRPGLDAKMALRRIHFGIADRGAREVVDADLSDYFNTIPHGDLMRCARAHCRWHRPCGNPQAGSTQPSLSAHRKACAALRKRRIVSEARRKEASSPRCWPTCISVASCWRGIATATPVVWAPKWSTMPMIS